MYAKQQIKKLESTLAQKLSLWQGLDETVCSLQKQLRHIPLEILLTYEALKNPVSNIPDSQENALSITSVDLKNFQTLEELRIQKLQYESEIKTLKINLSNARILNRHPVFKKTFQPSLLQPIFAPMSIEARTV